jgi:hypothetical protein
MTKCVLCPHDNKNTYNTNNINIQIEIQNLSIQILKHNIHIYPKKASP